MAQTLVFTRENQGFSITRAGIKVSYLATSIRVYPRIDEPEVKIEITQFNTPLSQYTVNVEKDDITVNEEPFTGTAEELADEFRDNVYSYGGGGGGGSAFLDPLFFGGTGTAEDPIVSLGFRGTDGNAYTYDGDEIVPLLLNPAAPTNFVGDDTDNTAAWTENPQYPNVEEYEISIDNGSTWDDATENPYQVGNIDIPIGHLHIRIKAVPDVSNASPSLVSNIAYTAVLQDIDDWQTMSSTNFSNTGNNTLHQGGLYADGCANFKFLPGAVGLVQADIDDITCAGYLGVDTVYEGVAPNYCDYRMSWNGDRIFGKVLAGSELFTDPGVTFSPTLKIRMRLDGETVWMEVSYNGTDWVFLNSGEQIQEDLYIKAFAEALPSQIHNIRALGAVPA